MAVSFIGGENRPAASHWQTTSHNVLLNKHVNHYVPRSGFPYYNLTTTYIVATFHVWLSAGHICGLSSGRNHQCTINQQKLQICKIISAHSDHHFLVKASEQCIVGLPQFSVRVTHLFLVFCVVVFCFVCLRPVSCVSSLVDLSELSWCFFRFCLTFIKHKIESK